MTHSLAHLRCSTKQSDAGFESYQRSESKNVKQQNFLETHLDFLSSHQKMAWMPKKEAHQLPAFDPQPTQEAVFLCLT